MKFRKKNKGRWLSHLDLQRLLLRACRRAALPLAYTEGFSPHPKLAFASALPVGVAGYRELVDIWLTKPLQTAEVVAQLNQNLPNSLMQVADCCLVPLNEPSLSKQIKEAEYQLIGELAVSWDQLLSVLPEPVKPVKVKKEKNSFLFRCPLTFSPRRVYQLWQQLNPQAAVKLTRLNLLS